MDLSRYEALLAADNWANSSMLFMIEFHGVECE